MGNKVRCRFCQFEVDKKCIKKKNSTVVRNKKRVCKLYEGDEDKIIAWAERRQNLEVSDRPSWFWSRSKRRKERDKMIQQEMERYQTTANKEVALPRTPKDPKHPLTGDLSQFVGSTADEKDEKS